MQSEGDSDFQRRKEELEQRIRELDEERMSLIKEVESLKQTRTLLDLQRRSKSLEETVDVLRKQRDDLEGEITQMGPQEEPQQATPDQPQ